MTMLLRRSIFVFVASLLSSVAEYYNEDNGLIEWIRLKGGFVDERQVIKRESGVRGVFVNDDVQEGELLLSLPWEALISPRFGGDFSFCDTIAATKREIQLGRESSFAPYVHQLKEAADELPNWSEAGKELLQLVAGANLPPHPQKLAPHLKSWAQNCGGDPVNDPDGAQAALLVLTRAHTVPHAGRMKNKKKSCMVPFYDMLNHRRGVWHNTKVISVVGGDLKIFARRDIKAGGQVYNSYETRDTSVIFNNWGFVEQYPHRWTFERTDHVDGIRTIDFAVDEHNSSIALDDLPLATWLSSTPSVEDISFLQRELDRLKLLEKRKKHKASGNMSVNENALIWKYHEALTFAIDRAIVSGRASGHQNVPYLFTMAGIVIGLLVFYFDLLKKGDKNKRNLARLYAKKKGKGY